jgi:hypothetical protein
LSFLELGENLVFIPERIVIAFLQIGLLGNGAESLMAGTVVLLIRVSHLPVAETVPSLVKLQRPIILVHLVGVNLAFSS